MSSATQQLLCPFQTSAIFCHTCGMLLRLESAQSRTVCKFCHQVTDIKNLLSDEVVTRKVLANKKEWMQDPTDENEQAERATVEQDCEQCDNNVMYFITRQTRSVDEGQTVYYQCTKCDHTFSQNT